MAQQQQQVQLSLFPVMYIPETVSLNKYANVQPDQVVHLYCTFDLLPDVLYEQLKLDLKVYCAANQVWEISWKLDDDITWTSTFFLFNLKIGFFFLKMSFFRTIVDLKSLCHTSIFSISFTYQHHQRHSSQSCKLENNQVK